MIVRWVWIFLDVAAPAEEGWRFWAAATGCRVGDRRGARAEFATLEPADGDPWLKLQEVASGGGVHLDLDVDDPALAAEAARALGAALVWAHPEGGYVVMRSPGGFVFCLTTWNGAHQQERAGLEVVLDQVCLDVPAPHYDAECTFWAALLRIEPVAGSLPQFRVLPRPSHLPVRIMLQRKDSGTGPVTGHPDFACRDRASAERQQLAWGAQKRASGPRWSVLAAPGGQVYCLTDRDPVSGTLPPASAT